MSDDAGSGVNAEWVVYILECGDGSLYTGVTNDLEKRVEAHREGRGAKYTQARGVRGVVYVEYGYTRGDAQRREIEVKKMKRTEKLALVDSTTAP